MLRVNGCGFHASAARAVHCPGMPEAPGASAAHEYHPLIAPWVTLLSAAQV